MIQAHHRNSHTIRVEGKYIKLYLLSDLHWDNPHCDRVALATLNRIELAFAEFGAQRLGAIPVPLNYMLTHDEIRDLIERCDARVLVTDYHVFHQSIRDRSSLPTLEPGLN